ncbi:MAG TPA: acylphosphatase [Gammaproteobacteria bacterium]
MTRCVRCLVSGKVQGVWYRGSTQQQAHRLGVTGYAKNLADGRVEVVACGEEGAIRALSEWLWQGPAGARVIEVACSPISGVDYQAFTTQ